MGDSRQVRMPTPGTRAWRPAYESCSVGPAIANTALPDDLIRTRSSTVSWIWRETALGSRLRKSVRNALVRAGGAFASLGGPKLGKRALALHEVPDIPRFRDFLDRLLAEYDVLGLEDWLKSPIGDRTQLTLTFDDGYASWHTAVAPLLAEQSVPAVFFVSSGLVGLQGKEAQEFARSRMRRSQELSFISLQQLRDLAEHALFEVGSHTRTHADLGRIGDRHTIREEIAGDRARLEDWLGSSVRWFSYPFGTPANVSPLARSVVEEVGMSAAFTLIPGWWEAKRGDPLLIGRDGLDPSVSFSVARAWLRGGYDRLYALKPQPR
jgi:peptidoglycan/xylan/chitin deacetylase (PgdA/CDA1 family)